MSQPTQYEKEAEFCSDPRLRPGKWDISFPVPPVHTGWWSGRDWVRYAENKGGKWRKTEA
jgi:hypothetical protein